MLGYKSRNKLDFLGEVLVSALLHDSAFDPQFYAQWNKNRPSCLHQHLAELNDRHCRLFLTCLEKIRINRVYDLLSAFRINPAGRNELELYLGGQNLLEFLPDENELAGLMFGPGSWVCRFEPTERLELQALLVPFQTSEWRIQFIPPANGPEFFIPGKAAEPGEDDDLSLSFVHPALDKFGLVMVETFKDKPLRWLESVLAGRNLDSPLEAELAQMDEGIKKMLLTKVNNDGETDIHAFLNILEWFNSCVEEDGIDEDGLQLYTLSLQADGQDVADLGDELDGLRYAIFGWHSNRGDGWLARYSEYPSGEDAELKYNKNIKIL